MISRPPLPPPRQTTFIRIIGFEYLHSHSRIEGKRKESEEEKKKEKKKKVSHSRVARRDSFELKLDALTERIKGNPFALSFFLANIRIFCLLVPILFSPLLRWSLLNTSSLLPTLGRASPRSTASCRFVSLPGLAWNRAWSRLLITTRLSLNC